MARVNEALRRLLQQHGSATPPLATSLDLYHELQAVTPDSLHYLLHDLFEANSWWELQTERATLPVGRLGAHFTVMTESSNAPAAPALEAQALNAALTVNDLSRSLAWYRDVLGFTIAREYAPRGTRVAAALRAGTVEILLTQDNGAQGANRVKGQGFSLQFTVGSTAEDIDALAAGIKQRGAVLEDEPASIAGARAFRLRDPDGFKLVFSSPRKRD